MCESGFDAVGSRKLTVLVLVCALAGALASPSAARAVAIRQVTGPGVYTAPHAGDHILVKFRPGTAAHQVGRLHAAARSRVIAEIPRIAVQIVGLPCDLSVERAVAFYARNPNVEFAEPDFVAPPDAIPNDPYYSSQWHLPKISAPTAWDATTGSNSVIVAILDTGVDGTHPDLAAKMVPGWNAYDNTTDSSDVSGHGTAVAGTAAACSNNAVGVASVAWNCLIMPIRISDPQGYAYGSTAAAGLTWAADHGARVANISYSMSTWSTVATAAHYFQASGGVVTCSAGNSGYFYTNADNPYIVTVSATDANDNLPSWSNTGNLMDVAAPGVGIRTTNREGGYGLWSGTSFSASVVAGAAALVLSANPTLSGQQVQEIIRESADDLGPAGWDPEYGCGRVSAERAISMALCADAPTVTCPATPDPICVDENCQAAIPDLCSGVVAEDNCDDALECTQDPAAGTLVGLGVHTVTVTVTDDAGNSASCTVDVTVLDCTSPTVPVSITLSEGWHMISLPLEPVNKTILIDRTTKVVDPKSIFANCLPDNDPRSQLFRMEPGVGYWIYNPSLYPCDAWYEIDVDPPYREPTPQCPDPIPHPGEWWQGFWFYVNAPGTTITYEAYPMPNPEPMVRSLDINKNFAPSTFTWAWILVGACARTPELSAWNPDVSTWPLTNTVTDLMWGNSWTEESPTAWLPTSDCAGDDAWDQGNIGLPIVGYLPGIGYYLVSPPAGLPPNYCGASADARYMAPGEGYWLDVERPDVRSKVGANLWQMPP